MTVVGYIPLVLLAPPQAFPVERERGAHQFDGWGASLSVWHRAQGVGHGRVYPQRAGHMLSAAIYDELDPQREVV